MCNSQKKNTTILVSLLVIIFISISCKENITTPIDTRNTFELDLTNYSTNHYFLDTIYASVLPEYNFYKNYYELIQRETSLSLYNKIKELKIWKQFVGVIDSTTPMRSNVFIDLPPLREDEKYDSTLYDIDQFEIPGEAIIYARFNILTEGTDYIYNNYTGVVTFLTDVTLTDVFATTYSIEGQTVSNEDDIYFGDSKSEETAILKLLRPGYLQPNFKQAWKLQLRNIYPIGANNIIKDGFELDIKISINGKLQDHIEVRGKPSQLITEFELDRIDESGAPNNDGKFDFRENMTITSNNGEIIFPVLEPFGRDLPKNIPDSFKVFSLYDTSKTFVEITDIPFKITGKYNN